MGHEVKLVIEDVTHSTRFYNEMMEWAAANCQASYRRDMRLVKLVVFEFDDEAEAIAFNVRFGP